MTLVGASILSLVVILFAAATAEAETIVVAPRGDPRLHRDLFVAESAAERPAVTLKDALRRAGPGTIIQLLDGTYDQLIADDRFDAVSSGSLERPITIRGLGDSSVLYFGSIVDGATLLAFVEDLESVDPNAKGYAGLPTFSRSANCIRIDGQSHIVIENLTIRGCRDAGVHVRNSDHITFRNSLVLGGRFAFLAEGLETHHLLVEGITWIQDPTEQMWRSDHWCEFKYGRKQHLNGALFGSWDIAGGVIIRRNKVFHAFNAVRMVATFGRHASLHDTVNVNVEIYENEFHFIRDNVVEPEFDATNWWIHDNVIHNAHAWFSFDGLYGGQFYVYNNTGYFDEKPSANCDDRCRTWRDRNPALCGDLHNGGRVLKFRKTAETLPGPVYVFNNSWYLRASIAKAGGVGALGHWNNAIEFCRRADHENGACSSKPFFRDFAWKPEYDFRFDLSNHPDFPEKLQADGYAVRGVQVPWPNKVFAAPTEGDFTLVTPVDERAGCFVTIEPSGAATCDPDRDDRPDIGAVQPTEKRTVFFRTLERNPYKENPRIVHVDWPALRQSDGSRVVRVVFSVPLAEADEVLSILVSWSNGHQVVSEPCAPSGNILRCSFGPSSVLFDFVPSSLLLPPGIKGTNGLRPTLWGRTAPFIAISPES